MKRNDLLAKSLTLGLAVATAAASMSTPALAGSQAVKADEVQAQETAVKLESSNVKEYFELAENTAVILDSTGNKHYEPNVRILKPLEGSLDSLYGGILKLTFKDSAGENAVNINEMQAGTEYKVYINVDGGSVLTAADNPVELGSVTAYNILDRNVELSFTDGTNTVVAKGDEEGDSLSKTTFTGDVTVSVKDDSGYTIATSASGSGDTSVKIEKVNGDKVVYLYGTKDGVTYVRRVGLQFSESTGENQKISGTVSLLGTAKYGDVLEAKVTGQQDNAVPKYQWLRTKNGNTETITGATDSTYTLGKDDMGCTITVEVSANGYTGSIVSDATTAVAKGDAYIVAPIEFESKTPNHADQSYTYKLKALETKTDAVANYGIKKPADEASKSVDEQGIEWGQNPEFSGLVPGSTYTFYVNYNLYLTEGADYRDCRAQSNPQIKEVTIDKLQHGKLTMTYDVTSQEDGGKKLTITAAKADDDKTDLEYTFDDGQTWETETEKTVGQNDLGRITFGVRYKTDEKYEEMAAVKKTINLSLDEQTAPTGLKVTAAPNQSKTAYDITVTEPEITGDEKLEYSLDDATWNDLESITKTGLSAETTFTLYARKKGTTTQNPSPSASVSITTAGKSTAPTITVINTEDGKRKVTITAQDSAAVYFTTNGSTPTIKSDAYEESFTVTKTTTVKAIAVENGKIVSDVVEKAGESTGSTGSSTGGYYDSSYIGGNTGSTGTTGSTNTGSDSTTNPDGSTTKTETTTNTDGSTTKTETTTNTDGSTTKTETTTSTDGSTTKTETTIKTDGSSETKTEVKNTDGSTETKTEVKNTDGSTEKVSEKTNTDGSTEKVTEKENADGSKETLSEVKNADGSTEKVTEKVNKDGSAQTTTEVKNADGSSEKVKEVVNVDGSSETRTVLRDGEGTTIVVNTEKNESGKTTDSSASVKQVSDDKGAVISADTVEQVVAAAGTKNVEITTKVVDSDGNTTCKVTINAKNLKAGKKLKVLKIDSKTGEKTLVNASTYKVDKDGNVSFDNLGKANYQVVTASEANKYSKQVLKTVKPAVSKKTVTEGKQTAFKLDVSLNKKNVKSIAYKTSKGSVASVDKNGKITAKKSGKATVKATVTLKNGKKKTVKMTVNVKAANESF